MRTATRLHPMSPSLRHRINNLAQSALIFAGMIAMVWVVVGLIAGPGLTALVIVGMVLGLLAAPAVPRRVLLSAYQACPLGPQDFPAGVTALAELAGRAGLPRPPTLWYVPSRLPNAFAMGRPEDSAICITDGLLRLLDGRELAGVLAHEVAHVAHRDLWIMALADGMSRVVSLASWVGQAILLVNLPLFLIGAEVVPWTVPLVLIFAPTLMGLLQLALSRSREFDADLGAVRLTGDPEGLARALLKLERRRGRFWEEIFLPGRRIPEPSLLRTHPPTQDRIARLSALAIPASERRRPPHPTTAPTFPPPPPPRFRRGSFFY